MRSRVSAALAGLLFLSVAGSAAQAAEFDNRLDGYSLTSWKDGNGRPLGSVYAIVQDGDGYLWVGTESGLFRFDGSQFTSWDGQNGQTLRESAVRALRVARDGSIWAGLSDAAGVAQLRGSTVRLHNEGLPSRATVTELAEDARGVFWAVIDGALYRLDEDRWRHVDLPWTTSPGQVFHLYVSPRNRLWIGTRWGVFEHDESSDGFRHLSESLVWGLSEDAAGGMWTTDIASGFRRLQAPVPAPDAFEGAGYRLLHDRKGGLWVATFGDGLWLVRGERSRDVQRADLRTGLLSDSVLSLMEDRDGNVWVGTTGGLHRFTERRLTPLQGVGFVLTAVRDRGGRISAGTTNGLVRFTPSAGDEEPAEWTRERIGPPGLDIRSFLRDPDGTLWVGTTSGLWHLSNGRLTRVPMSPAPDMIVYTVVSDRHGGLWLRGADWVYRWDGTTLVPFEGVVRSGETAAITLLRADRSQRVWMGFAGGRIGVLDVNGAFRLLGPDEGLEPDGSRALHDVLEDSRGSVWLGTSVGLSRFADGRATTVTQANGLPGNRVWAIAEDLQNRLWLTVDRGLVRVEPSEIDKAVADPSYRVHYQMYDALDGLAGGAMISQSVLMPDGTLWVVRGGSVTLVDTAKLDDRRAPPPPARIMEATANDRPFSVADRGLFPSGTNRVQIGYTALTVGGRSNVRFRHKLDGFDADWVEAGSRRTAFYTNLSPGDYRFQVEARWEFGTWETSKAAWVFSIRPAFYQTTWFFALCGAGFTLSLWGAWRFRLRLVQRQFSLVLSERARLSREIHDTLLQSLVGVALQFDAIAGRLGPSSSEARDQLVRLRRQVEMYIREARHSIWALRSPELQAQDLPTALQEIGEKATRDRPVRFTSTVSGTPRDCSPTIGVQLLRIGQEAITNAVRHARATAIHLDLRFERDSVAMRISDDGQGFEAEDRAPSAVEHFGLTVMRERAEQIGARLTITSSPGQGTIVETIVPTAVTPEPSPVSA